MVLARAAIGAAALLAVCAQAQQAPPAVDPTAPSATPTRQENLVVTGTYLPAPLEEVDRSVEAIAVGESRPLYANWADALRLDASVDLRQRAPGVQADLSIRGSSFGQTLVLVDGLRVNDAQSGHHNLDLPIPFESIDRIEVLHGSGSTLYGSDAMGGAVNFITAPAAATDVRLGLAGGNFGTNEENGSAGWLGRRASEELSFTRDFSSGFMPDRDYRNLALASESHLKTELGDSAVLLGLSDRPFGADQFYGNFPSWERTKGWFVGATQSLGAQTEAAFGYRRHTDEFVLFRDQPAIYENNHVTESWQAALRRHDALAQNATLFYGVEGYRDTIDSNNLGNHARDQGALYLDLDVRAWRRFSFSAGTREEAFTGTHAEFSPSVSGGYWISRHLKLRASASHAFRLPTYTDLYYSDPANVGNPNLLPETAWGYDGGVAWNGGARWTGEVTMFQRRERNGIDYIRSSPTDVWRAANIDRLNFTGVEAAARVKAGSGQSFEVGYTGIYGAQQALAGIQSRYVSDYPVDSFSAGWLGKVPRAVQGRVRLGVVRRYQQSAYPLLEVSLGRQFAHVQPYVQFTNLTNTGYEEIPGVRMPGRAVVAGVEVELRRVKK